MYIMYMVEFVTITLQSAGMYAVHGIDVYIMEFLLLQYSILEYIMKVPKIE